MQRELAVVGRVRTAIGTWGKNKVDRMTVTIGRGTTSQQRRESAAERLSAMSAALEAFDADLAARPPGSTGVLDLYGLRRVARALLPLALDDPTFDVTASVGSTGAAVRVHHAEGSGPTARLILESGPKHARTDEREPAVEPPQAGASPPSPVAWELAELLRRGWGRGQVAQGEQAPR
jgi:hypothetical protein